MKIRVPWLKRQRNSAGQHDKSRINIVGIGIRKPEIDIGV
jgi:hypothetical protein